MVYLINALFYVALNTKSMNLVSKRIDLANAKSLDQTSVMDDYLRGQLLLSKVLTINCKGH